MSDRPKKSKRKRRCYFYHYECPECSSQWAAAITKGSVVRVCRNCNIEVQPYKKTTEPELDPNRRYFGNYKCPECFRTWMSANSWVGYGQQCEACKINVMPHKQTPLRPSRGGDNKKEHPSELCGKCRSLGHSCRKNIK